MSGSKRKTRSLERDIEEEPVTWKSFIKTLEKPNVPLELNHKTLLKEQKSQAVVNFWENVDDLQNKARLGEELFTIHFSDLVRNRSSKIIHELEDSDETVFSSGTDSEKDDDFEDAYIIDLDNVANQINPPFCSDDEWTSITSVTQISTELPHPVEEQLGFDLNEFDIKKTRASFKSYTKTTPFTDVDEYTRRIFDYFIDDKELLIFELSGAPTRLPVRRSVDDKIKLDECLLDMVSIVEERYPGSVCQQGCKIYDLFRTMFGFRNELAASLDIIMILSKKSKLQGPENL
ncbi:39271_t:CDS:2, partial [Gigaspora margarita]